MENKGLALAWQIIANTDTHLFLTGKAGTGKTTFLRNLRDELPKRMVVVAPTGIAAINAQGTTIHSFFQLGFGPLIPGAQQTSKKYKFRKSKLQLIRSVDLIVIDEISMVRADVLDAIDGVLRQYRDRSKPFGGVQMLMIGDMQQLAPVAKEDEWRMLSPYYATPYFFSSKVLENTPFVTVELQKVYRQSDAFFLDLLNKVRTNTADADTLATLNQRYIPNFMPAREDGYIRLTTHNYQADTINRQEMDKLTTAPMTFVAVIEKEFPETSFPTEETLTLKKGAQVMFIKNDSSPEKNYYNGMIGEVTDFEENVIVVRALENNEYINVGHETWENTRYDLNPDTKEITEEVIGTFSQYPLKPAWAITVHKSQGLTFEKAIIDVQQSFAHGQTYVALSRCKSLEGMVLSNPIPPSAIINDAAVSQFTNDPRHQQPDNERLELMERQYMLRLMDELFSFTSLHFGFNDMIRLMREHFYGSQPRTYAAWNEALEKFKGPEDVARKFHNQYCNLVMSSPDFRTNALIQERLRKGAAYFEGEIVFIGLLLNRTVLNTDNKQLKERIENIFGKLREDYKLKAKMLHYVANSGMNIQEYLKTKATVMLHIEDEEEKKSATASRKGSYAPKSTKKKQSKGVMFPTNDIDDLPY